MDSRRGFPQLPVAGNHLRITGAFLNMIQYTPPGLRYFLSRDSDDWICGAKNRPQNIQRQTSAKRQNRHQGKKELPL